MLISATDASEQGKWARTDDGNTQGSTTATFKNPQANYAPQHGGSSGAYGDSAAPAANGGFQIVMSQLSDRKDDGTGPAWEYTKPPVLYMVVRHDLDTIKFVPSDIHSMAKRYKEIPVRGVEFCNKRLSAQGAQSLLSLHR